MRISDWSSDVCSSDLSRTSYQNNFTVELTRHRNSLLVCNHIWCDRFIKDGDQIILRKRFAHLHSTGLHQFSQLIDQPFRVIRAHIVTRHIILLWRSEENTYEFQSLMSNSYAVFF